MVERFTREDFAHVASLLRTLSDDDLQFRAVSSNNYNVILSALDFAAATHPADRDGVEAGGNRAATFTYEDDEHAGPLYYFTPAIRPPGPYRQQRHVNAVVDIAADGSFAGVELIDNMPPLAPPVSALKGGA